MHDTFNRGDQPLLQLAGGRAVTVAGKWDVRSGNLMAVPATATTYLLTDAGRADVDMAVDVFLEQTRKPATAGLVLRARDTRNMQRFLIRADGPAVKVSFDTLVDGRPTTAVEQVRATLQRGFTLRCVARGPRLTYYLGGVVVGEATRPEWLAATQVGLLAEGEASRFDNFEVRRTE